MASQQHRRNRQVRILVCPQNHPDHVGKVGTAGPYNHVTAAQRVYVGTGICQATTVEPVAEDLVVVTPIPIQWPMHRPLPGA